MKVVRPEVWYVLFWIVIWLITPFYWRWVLQGGI